jgi:hypothetical protein
MKGFKKYKIQKKYSFVLTSNVIPVNIAAEKIQKYKHYNTIILIISIYIYIYILREFCIFCIF